MAAVFWIGGVFFFTLILSPKLSTIPPAQAGILIRHVGRRFLVVAWASMSVLAGAGLTIAFRLGLLNTTFLTSAPGFLLLAKMVFLATAFVNAILITFVLLPVAMSRNPRALQANRRIERLSIANLAVGLAALLFGVLL